MCQGGVIHWQFTAGNWQKGVCLQIKYDMRQIRFWYFELYWQELIALPLYLTATVANWQVNMKEIDFVGKSVMFKK